MRTLRRALLAGAAVLCCAALFSGCPDDTSGEDGGRGEAHRRPSEHHAALEVLSLARGEEVAGAVPERASEQHPEPAGQQRVGVRLDRAGD